MTRISCLVKRYWDHEASIVILEKILVKIRVTMKVILT